MEINAACFEIHKLQKYTRWHYVEMLNFKLGGTWRSHWPVNQLCTNGFLDLRFKSMCFLLMGDTKRQ